MIWWQRLWRRRQMEDQLETELRHHIEQHAADLMAHGYSAGAARREARIALGGPEQVKESCRDARGTRWIEDLFHDVRYALRTLRQRPGFAAVALATLALGTGATTIMFTLINGVLLRPLPYSHPDTLLVVHGHSPTWNVQLYREQKVAYPDFLDMQRESRSVAMAAWLYDGGTVSAPGDPQYVDNFPISWNLFDLFGVNLLQGRAFLPEEDKPGGAPVIILGHKFWERKFGGSASAIGSRVVLDDKPYTVVGIARENFRLDDNEADTFTPLGQDTAPYLKSRGPHPINIAARLRPGVTVAQVQTELALISHRLAAEYPDTNKDRSFFAEPIHVDVGDARATLWLLFGAVGLVLLIACANVASLLLARAISRERELAMRAALGAGRGRLIRQCLTESCVLSCLGGALGVALAAIGVRPFVKFWPGSLPRAEDVQLDWNVLWFGLGVSLLSGILFGLVPALRIRARDLEHSLRAGARTLVGSSRRLHGLFVTAEIAIAMVLLVSAGMLGRTLLHLSSLNPGLDIHNLLVSRMALAPATLKDAGLMRAAWNEVLERARRVPGVDSAAVVDTVPLRQGENELGYWTSADVPPTNKLPFALATSATPDYLRVMKMPLLKGRFFNDYDRIGSEPVVVIDDVLAQHAFGDSDAVGKRLWIPDMAPKPFLVVGVVAHVRHWGLAADDQSPVRDQFYYPYAQVPDVLMRRWSELTSIVVRTKVNPLSILPTLRKQLRGETGEQVLYEVQTMEQLAKLSLARQRFLMLLFGVFAGLALLLACIGVYGVLAYLTGQRVSEIGMRMALGASARGIEWMVLRQSLVMISAGAAIGLSAAFGAAYALRRTVQGMQPPEAGTFVLTLLVLIVAGLVASFLPARRASRVDPMTALRAD